MKKILTKILTLIGMSIFVFSFAACGSNGEKGESGVLETYDFAEAESSTTTRPSAEGSTSTERLQEDTDESNNAESAVTEPTTASKKKSTQKKKTKKEASSQAETAGNNSSTKTTTKAAAKTTTKSKTQSTTKAAAQSTTKHTTQSTTKSKTQTTTKATTKSTTQSTTKPTTQSTTKPTTKPTTQPTTQTKPPVVEEDKNMLKIEIVVGNKSFSATLYDNAAAKALLEMLPMTLNMSELNGNEKYYYLDNNLPTNSSRPSGIEAGDIMLYGNNCLVLFYESFSTSYSYTPLGRIDDPKGLAEALGSGSVQVTFKKG